MKRKYLGQNVKVGDVLKALSEYPENARFTVLGDPVVYIHFDETINTVVIDDSPLDECYDEPEDGDKG